MHVALFSPSWPLARYPNGVVTYVHWMREELRRQGHRVSIFTATPDVSEADVHVIRSSWLRHLVEKIQLKIPFKVLPKREWSATIADSIRGVHRTDAIDVIEMEESFGWIADIGRRTRIPTVVKLHGPAFMSLVEEELNTPFADAKIAAEGTALRQSPVVISPANRTLVETITHYGLSPTVSRHIVNPLRLPKEAPLWQLAHCDQRTILFVGRFDKRKGGDIVLQAFARLLEKNPDLKLLFVGPDYGVLDAADRRVHLEEMKASLFAGPGADRVSYLGKLGPNDIYQVRLRALVTIVASRWENQSYTALEAMLQGCPIVSSETGGQGEIIEDGVSGLLAVAGDPKDLARQIQVLLDDPQRAAEMGAKARQRISEQHAPERVVAQTLEAYRDAISIAQQGRR